MVVLQTVVHEYLGQLSSEKRGAVYFQQDGAAPHRTKAVLQHLKTVFGDRLIAHGTTIEWPARSPDLTPMDFFFWGYIKDKVYKTPSIDMNQLIMRIRVACEDVSKAMLIRAAKNVFHRARRCLEREGGHIEHIGNM